MQNPGSFGLQMFRNLYDISVFGGHVTHIRRTTRQTATSFNGLSCCSTRGRLAPHVYDFYLSESGRRWIAGLVKNPLAAADIELVPLD